MRQFLYACMIFAHLVTIIDHDEHDKVKAQDKQVV